MLTKRTVLDQIEITRAGHIQVRMRKEIIDGEVVLAFEYHRTVVECGCDCDLQFSAVNEHLRRMSCATVSDADVARVKKHAVAAWTPELLDAASADVKRKISELNRQHAVIAEKMAILHRASMLLDAEEKKIAQKAQVLRDAARGLSRTK